MSIQDTAPTDGPVESSQINYSHVHFSKHTPSLLFLFSFSPLSLSLSDPLTGSLRFIPFLSLILSLLLLPLSFLLFSVLFFVPAFLCIFFLPVTLTFPLCYSLCVSFLCSCDPFLLTFFLPSFPSFIVSLLFYVAC
jgi:hypothetical protein